jgi:hypothetical protein
MQLYFERMQPGKDGVRKRYKVISFDTEKNTVTLQGSGPNAFVEPFDKARFEQMGYKLVKVEENENV